MAKYLFPFLFALPVQAANVNLAWNANPEPNISGYKLYSGIASGSYGQPSNVGNVTATTVSNLASGIVYYFALTAYDVNTFESGFSPETTYTVPTPTPASIGISGALSTCVGPGVAYTVSLSGGATVVTGGSGNYSFTGLAPGNTYTVTPSKPDLVPGGFGISGADAIAVQRHYTGQSLPICQQAAADVNGDGEIDTVDVIGIQRFFLGITTGVANVGKHRFTPVDRTYVNVTANQINQNFDVAILGDVTAPFVP